VLVADLIDTNILLLYKPKFEVSFTSGNNSLLYSRHNFNKLRRSSVIFDTKHPTIFCVLIAEKSKIAQHCNM